MPREKKEREEKKKNIKKETPAKKRVVRTQGKKLREEAKREIPAIQEKIAEDTVQNVSKPEFISWRAAEYEYGEKTLSWQLSVIGITLLVALVGFLMKNVFFGIFILFAGGLLLFFSRRRPEIFEFEVSAHGVEVKGKLTVPFENIKHFSIRARQGMLHELILRKNTSVNPYVRIPIDEVTGEKVAAFLRERIPEVEYEESIIDLVSDWLGL